jgi:hypothetical protein
VLSSVRGAIVTLRSAGRASPWPGPNCGWVLPRIGALGLTIYQEILFSVIAAMHAVMVGDLIATVLRWLW